MAIVTDSGRRISLSTLAVLLLCAIPHLAFAQDAGYLPDNTLGLVPSAPEGPIRTPLTITTITSADGYDNFDIGVDNAEPHMSSSPVNSTWFFNAFNTNRGHYTLNGHDWSFITPPFPSSAGDPWTAYDSLGNLYYMTMKNPITGTWIIKSTNGGATWTTPVSGVNGSDRCTMAADQTAGPYANYVYAAMTGSGGTANFARSTDGGATFVQTYQQTISLPSCMIAVGPRIGPGEDVPGGSVYFVTSTGSTANSTYNFGRSTDGGLTFSVRSTLNVAGYVGTLNSVGRLVINNARTRPYPFIAADNSYGPYRGRLYLVYTTNVPAGDGNKPDIFLHYSTDQGATWTPRIQVNDNENPSTTNEWFPSIWCDRETGRLYIKWYDMRNDPANLRATVYATYSDDGGQTFAPNQQISNADFAYPAPACSPNSNCYRGDYDAITSNRYTSLAVWTDFRNNNSGSVVAYFPDFAMKVRPAADTLRLSDSTSIVVSVPGVKLYTHPVHFTATVSPPADISLSFPQGDSLTSYPDSLVLGIRTNDVAEGTYAVTIVGQGPNGTPVHRRTVNMLVRYVPNTLTLVQPAGGEIWISGTSRSIRWAGTGDVDTVAIEYSTNGGTSWVTVDPGVPSTGTYAWTVPATPTTQAKVRVSWPDSSTVSAQSAGVFRISQPTSLVAVNRDSLSASIPFGPNTQHDTLHIANTGTLPLTWNLAETLPWLSLSPASGTVDPDSSRSVVVTFDATGLAGGTYAGIVSLTSNDTVHGTLTLPARLVVVISPAISVSSGTLTFGSILAGDSTSLVMTVRNTGSDTLRIGSFAVANEGPYNASLDGMQVVPPVITTASGTGRFELVNGNVQLSYNIRVAGLGGAITQANFRTGTPGSNGGIVRGLTFTGDSSVGTWSNIGIQQFTPALRDSLMRGRLYVNVQTADNPEGEIRGQVTGGFLMDEAAATIAIGDSLTRTVTFAPPLDGDFTGVIRIVSNDPDPADDTLFVVLEGTGLPVPVSVGDPERGLPTTYELSQNFPNPFNPTTHITFALPEAAFVRLAVYNVLGQELVVLTEGERQAGYHDVGWSGRNLAGATVGSGVYIYRLEAKGTTGVPFVSMRKMVLVK